MKEAKVQSKLFIFMQIALFCMLSFSFLFFLFTYKGASALDLDSTNSTLVGEGVLDNTNGLGFSFSETSTSTEVSDSSPLNVEYKGADYIISAEVANDGTLTGTRSYQWYFSEAGDIYTAIDGETDLQLTVCDTIDSGYYILQVLNDGEAFGDSAAFQVTITPKEITLTNISVKDKVFDDTTNVNFSFSQSEKLFEQDAEILLTGEVSDKNVGEGKLVSNIDASISNLELNNNYEIVFDTPNNVSVDILPMPVVVNFNSFEQVTYDGTNHISEINPFYSDIHGARKYLSFSVTFGATSVDEIVTAGTYEISLISQAGDQNYEFYTDSSFETEVSVYRFRVLKATPVISLSKTTFVYTGEEQDVRDFVSVNNVEQAGRLTFSSVTTFTTYAEGMSLGSIRVVAPETTNYIRVEETFTITVEKATPEFDFSSVKTEYEYTGTLQTFDTSSIGINNSEQTLIASVSNFQNVGRYEVMLQVEESDNYKAYVLDNLEVEIVKRKIDVSKLSWGETTSFTFEKGRVREVVLRDVPAQVVANYENNSNTDAGVYVASVSFSLRDENNYELVGSVPNLVWEIRKRAISKPQVTSNTEFVYDGKPKTITINQNVDYYSISGNTSIGAGEYIAKVSLVDPANTMWTDSTNTPIEYTWTILKQVVAIPDFSTQVEYTGESVGLNIENSELYTVYGASGTSLGEYTAILVLNDGNNYMWENTENLLIEVNWEIVGTLQEDNTSPITAIIIGIVVILVLGIVVTLQFTVVRKKRNDRDIIKESVNSSQVDELMSIEGKQNSGKNLTENEQNSIQARTEQQVEKAKTTIRKRKSVASTTDAKSKSVKTSVKKTSSNKAVSTSQKAKTTGKSTLKDKK